MFCRFSEEGDPFVQDHDPPDHLVLGSVPGPVVSVDPVVRVVLDVSPDEVAVVVLFLPVHFCALLGAVCALPAFPARPGGLPGSGGGLCDRGGGAPLSLGSYILYTIPYILSTLLYIHFEIFL